MPASEDNHAAHDYAGHMKPSLTILVALLLAPLGAPRAADAMTIDRRPR